MYRTDKQFMKNPATASSRIYIGSLAESVVPDSLEEKFSPHGKILGLVLQRGFGFIQFQDETQAQAAIKNEHGTMFHGRKCIVKQAIDNTKKNMQQQQQQNNFPQRNQMNQQQQQPSPMKEEPSKPLLESPKQPPPLLNNPPPLIPKAPSPKPLMQMDAPPPIMKPVEDNMHDKRKRGGGNGGGKRPMQQKRDYRDDYREENPYYEPPPPYTGSTYHAPILDRPERNDCEIIVVSKALTEYSEYIEQRLKSLGLVVDLLFPNEDVPIGRVLANISSRGCLFAILVMPLNEEHRSLTLNILHGIAEEHRNMPIEDAFLLITRNFETYMRGEKGGPNGSNDPDKMSLTSRHPEHIQVILNLLAENRLVKTGQYDKLISYMQEKRELQGQFEITEGIDSALEPEVKGKQSELQNRIMNILNKKGDEPQKIEPSKPPNSTPLLNDPSVQKALDSLLLGDMFKGLTS